ncbi:MAG: radical SAM protein [Candidatus Hydrothermales bacterium]
MKFKYIYGPVNSRRFGKSLGIDLLPLKTCNFNCVFCQLGGTYKLTNERKEYVPFEKVIEEVIEGVKRFNPCVLTFSGSGEPLLYSRLGEMIDKLKFLLPYQKIALLTHAPFLNRREIRDEIKNLDIFCPSLDAGTEKTFLKLSRPHHDIKYEDIKEGLLKMREEFKGRYELEIMYIEGLNDSEEDIKNLNSFVNKLNPHMVYINTPSRPPAENWVKLPSYEKALDFAKKISDKAQVIYLPSKQLNENLLTFEEILDAIKRRPYEFNEIKKLTRINEKELKERLLKEIEKGTLRVTLIKDKEFYFYRK